MPDGPHDKRSFEAGQEAGRISQILSEHEKHFETINGSIDKTRDALLQLAAEIRLLREDARLKQERVEVAADTLATETERRRSDLADTVGKQDRQFTRRERVGALVFTGLLAVVGYLLGK